METDDNDNDNDNDDDDDDDDDEVLLSIGQSDTLTPLNLSQTDMRRLARVARTQSTKSEPVLTRQSSFMNHLGTSMRRKMSSASQVIAREEGRTAKVYTISLLLLLVTWSPFYILSMLSSILHLPFTSLSLSPVVSSLGKIQKEKIK